MKACRECSINREDTGSLVEDEKGYICKDCKIEILEQSDITLKAIDIEKYFSVSFTGLKKARKDLDHDELVALALEETAEFFECTSQEVKGIIKFEEISDRMRGEAK